MVLFDLGMGALYKRREIVVIELIKGAAFLVFILLVIYSLWYVNQTTDEEMEEMGLITPKMARDPKISARMERETPLGVKEGLQEAVETARLSEMADKEVGEDGVVVRKKN